MPEMVSGQRDEIGPRSAKRRPSISICFSAVFSLGNMLTKHLAMLAGARLTNVWRPESKAQTQAERRALASQKG